MYRALFTPRNVAMRGDSSVVANLSFTTLIERCFIASGREMTAGHNTLSSPGALRNKGRREESERICSTVTHEYAGIFPATTPYAMCLLV